MALSPTSSRGSSSAQPHTHEVLGNTETTIANNAEGSVTWALSFGPDTLLNIAVPALPTIITSGIYAFKVGLTGNELTVGGYFTSTLELDVAGEANGANLVSNLATAADGAQVTLTITSYLTAGMQVRALVSNRDGVSARGFSLSALVQRVG